MIISASKAVNKKKMAQNLLPIKIAVSRESYCLVPIVVRLLQRFLNEA